MGNQVQEREGGRFSEQSENSKDHDDDQDEREQHEDDAEHEKDSEHEDQRAKQQQDDDYVMLEVKHQKGCNSTLYLCLEQV